MATRTDKKTFFAQLDSLDESTETESESDREQKVAQEASRKRQKLSNDLNTSNAVSALGNVATKSDRTSKNNIKPPTRPTPPVLERASTDGRADKDKPVVQTNQQKTLRRTKSASESSKKTGKETPKPQQTSDKKRLFDKLTFFFIPNNDVAKPRRLRIQSAIRWAGSGHAWAGEIDNLNSGIKRLLQDYKPRETATRN